MNDSFRIRLARPDEIARLREIEDEAGTMFSGLGLIEGALDGSFPVDDLRRLVAMGQVWVGCTEDDTEDRPVGMVIASVCEHAAYVEELDVMPKFGNPAEWTPGMWLIRENEMRHGLKVEARVFMRRRVRNHD